MKLPRQKWLVTNLLMPIVIALIPAIFVQCYRPKPLTAIQKLINQLGDEDKKIRNSSVNELLKNMPQSIPPLIEALKNKNAEIREGAAWALGEMRYKSPLIIDALQKTLKDNVVEVREGAAWALHKIFN